MEEKRRYIWEESRRAYMKPARKYRRRKHNVERLEEIDEAIRDTEHIIELVEKAQEAEVLERSFRFFSYSDEENGEVAEIEFRDGHLTIVYNVYGMTPQERTELEQKVKKKSTAEILNRFYKRLLEEREKQIAILNDLSKYEVVEYVEDEEGDDDEW